MFYLPVIVSFICLIFLIYVSFLIYCILFVIVFHISFLFLYFLVCHTACRILIHELELLWWEDQVQTAGLTETLRPHGILFGVRAWRATSKHLVLALLNCLQTPVLKFSGQSISERRTQFRLTKTMIWQKICYRQKSKAKKPKRPHKWRGNRETTWKTI